jgi:transcriptional regulator with XRE-family HTH domain
MLLGMYIREMRKAKGYGLRQLAREINISAQHLSEIERGQTGASDTMMTKIATALELDIAELMARGGFIPCNLKEYIMLHTSAGVLLQRLITYNLSDKSIRMFIGHLDEVVEAARKRKQEIEDKKKSVY